MRMIGGIKSAAFYCALIILLVGVVETAALAQAPKPVKEIRPGLLEGYLARTELPNSLILVPAPPAPDSAAFALDQDYAKRTVESKDTARFQQAVVDADITFPAATKLFESAVGVEISEAKTPHLYILMRRVLTDAALSVSAAKAQHKRQRPFMVNNAPICTPKDEAALRKDGSYPSGHATTGWAWALVLAEIFPAKTEVILQRGLDFGESRVVCNLHWRSDIEMSRLMGTAVVARLHANATFQEDLAAAKKEVK